MAIPCCGRARDRRIRMGVRADRIDRCRPRRRAGRANGIGRARRARERIHRRFLGGTTLRAAAASPRVTEHIAREYADSAVTREALTQIAYGWNQAVNDVHDPGDAKIAGDAIAKGIACALSARVLAKAGIDQQTMLDRIKGTRAVMLDTETDTLAYIRFQSLAGGQFFDDPGPASCGFNPTAMPN